MTVLPVFTARAEPLPCGTLLERPAVSALTLRFKKAVVDKILDVMAAVNGLPKYLKLIEDSRRTGSYLKYRNFGEMGLAEIGISVRYNQARFDALKTGRPLIIVANHHLGIADGLALQYMLGQSRPTPSLLFLARWIEKLLPHAVYGVERPWGTAVPVEINLPKVSDPNYKKKLDEVKAFNSSWGRTALRVLRGNGALIVFPAGHVSSIVADATYPSGVQDDPYSWQDGFLNMARLGKADIVFANVDSVNGKSFYLNRKRFGGGDKERVIWFFKEALAKKGKAIDVHLSEPMSLDTMYETLSSKHGHSIEALKADPRQTAEFMRQYSYGLAEVGPGELDITDSPMTSQSSEPR